MSQPCSLRPPAEPVPVIGYSLHGNRYLNVTNRCTLRCAFCPKFNGVWDVQDYRLRLYKEPEPQEIRAAVGDPRAYRQVVFCGLGESTLRLDVLLEIARWVRAEGGRVRINTDGLANLVYGRDVTPEFEGYIDALSISLNAQDEATYARHCRPKLPGAFEAVLDFTRRAAGHVEDVSLTALDGLEGVDMAACERLAADLGVGFRRRVLDEVG